MPSQKLHLYLLITILLVLGLSMFSYRHFGLDVPLKAQAEVSSWTVEANLKFQARPGKPIKAKFVIPYLPPSFTTLDEYYVSYDYGLTTNVVDDNRQTIWSIRRANGLQSLYYRAIFRPAKHESYDLEPPKAFLPLELSDAEKAATEALVVEARKSSADVETFAQAVLTRLAHGSGSSKVLLKGNFSAENKVREAIKILSFANIHAESAKLLQLKKQNHAGLSPWLMVFNEKKWLFINPVTGMSGLPKDMLLWQYGDEPTFSVAGGSKPQFTLTVSPTPVSALSVAKIRGTQTASTMMKFSLLQLPLNLQENYKILLTVPIGAFIILLLRNFVGLVTFGTFMPVLIALAFRETHILWGVSLFSLIVSVGLMIRFYLDELRLMIVPRLGVILTVVIMLMLAISVVSTQMDVQSGLSVALFPMVILTMVIERMCISWDERGAFEAIKAGVGSLIAAVLCYLVMNNPEVQYLLFAYPELLLILIAVILLFGQYRGYRLFELLRFKALAKL
jgi:hypothetical protein